MHLKSTLVIPTPAFILAFWLFFSFNAYPQPQDIVDSFVSEHATGDLPEIKQRKKIRALVTYGRSGFFFSKQGALIGFQVDLMTEFEKHLNRGVKKEAQRVRVQYIPTTFDRLIPDLIAGRGDIIAAMLTATPQRTALIDIVKGKNIIGNEVVVIHNSETAINSLLDLSEREVYVLRGSSYVDHLKAVNQQFLEQGIAPIKIIEAESYLSSEDIMELVNTGVVTITVVDDYKAKLWAKILPNIKVIESIAVAQGTKIGWGVRSDNPELKASLESFLKSVKQGTYLGNMLFSRYFKRTKWIKHPLSDDYRVKFRSLIKIFEKYGEKYGYDHLALVAQGFQESGLNQNMKRPRGAIGIMQVLPSTAADKNVGIPDISTADNNIHAGVKYLAFLRDRYFNASEITAINRMAFSLAAYNAGPARINKVRKLTVDMGLDPNVWHGNVELAAGRIVGRETIQYVNNIFKYYIAYSLLKKQNEQSATFR